MEKYLKWILLIVSGQFLCILSLMVGIFVLARVLQILGLILGAAGMIFAFSDWIKKQDRERK